MSERISHQEIAENENEDSLIYLVDPNNHYAVLGLEYGASEEDIKKDYPFFKSFYEKNKDNKSFEVKKQAYDVLLDRGLRILYDRHFKVVKDTETLLNKYVIPEENRAAVAASVKSKLNGFSSQFQFIVSRWADGNMIVKRLQRIDFQKIANEFEKNLLAFIPSAVQGAGGSLRKDAPKKLVKVPVAAQAPPRVSMQEEEPGSDSTPDEDFSLDPDNEHEKPAVKEPVAAKTKIDAETVDLPAVEDDFSGELMAPELIQGHFDSQKVAKLAPESLRGKRDRLEALQDELANSASDPERKRFIQEYIDGLTADIASHEDIEYKKKTGEDINKDIDRFLQKELKKRKEEKPLLLPEEYRKERLAKEEKYVKEQDRKDAQDMLRARIKKESFGLGDNEHGRFFDERGNLVEGEFQKFFKQAVAESGVSETSFCKMLSMGYRLDLIKDIKGLINRALAGGAKTELPCEGGASIYYWTEGQLDGLREFALAQEQVVRQEAVQRLAIPLYHEDGREVTGDEIRDRFVDEEMKRAQAVYVKVPNHELYRQKMGLSEEAFCMMVNMGYKIDGTVKYPKSFCEWMEKETEKKIKEETRARQKVIDKYKPHQENRQLLQKKVRKALLKKYSIT